MGGLLLVYPHYTLFPALNCCNLVMIVFFGYCKLWACEKDMVGMLKRWPKLNSANTESPTVRRASEARMLANMFSYITGKKVDSSFKHCNYISEKSLVGVSEMYSWYTFYIPDIPPKSSKWPMSFWEKMWLSQRQKINRQSKPNGMCITSSNRCELTGLCDFGMTPPILDAAIIAGKSEWAPYNSSRHIKCLNKYTVYSIQYIVINWVYCFHWISMQIQRGK